MTRKRSRLSPEVTEGGKAPAHLDQNTDDLGHVGNISWARPSPPERTLPE